MSNTDSITNNSIPRIIITAGEPAGIGPDLIVNIAQLKFNAELTVVGDPDILRQRAELLGLTVELIEFESVNTTELHNPGRLKIISSKAPQAVIPGKVVTANAAYVLGAIQTATQECLQQNFDAMVTTPVNKAVINDAGYTFSGHTEFLAELCGDVFPVMMLMNKQLRVALVTTHLPLSQVPELITQQHLERVLTVLHKSLRSLFRIKNPKIIVCGLNPHAGEKGHLGQEETKIIIPVLEKLISAGMDLTGPVPADTAFTCASLQGIDVVVTMYHDQGLPVLKSQGFGEIVNITLGLPVIRTSVDHGTALRLAGTGRANPDSLITAINCAIDLSNLKCINSGMTKRDAVRN